MSAPVRVLFVEDSQGDVELIVHALRRGGLAPEYEVVDTESAMRGALAGREWDVIVSDHKMPQFDAPAALRVLQESGRDLPFIVVSGNIGEELAVECMRAGASDYVNKDHLARLGPAIQRELREHEQRRQRQRAEQALNQSQERYRLLVENATDLISVLDATGRLTFVSPSVSRSLGYTPEEMMGRPVIELVHPDDAERVTQALRDALERGEPAALSGVRIRHRNGTWRIFEGSGTRVTDDRGALQLVTSAHDITERTLLEEQLHQSQKMEAVGRLAGGVAHDFNNLLTVILGYSNLLQDQLAREPTLRQEVEEVHRAAVRAANLTQQLLAFSRKQVLSLKVMDLNAIVEGMRDLLGRLIGEDVELVLRLNPDLGHVRVDPGQVEQVIMNLAINARDAMPNGGRLVIETTNTTLDNFYARRRAVQPGPYVMIAVTDSGHGMDDETQARLFEPFFTTKEPGKGTGLGLATTYGIVRQFGGNIFVYSEPGHGSTFKIYLPRASAPAERPSPPPEPSEMRRGTETILLVEDESVVRGLVANILRQHGYTVLDVENGDRAIETARTHRGLIHLMMTDVVMPGPSGLEVARRLAEERPEMRVLYLSGYTDDLVVRHGQLPPGRAFVQKPFTPDALLSKVRELLDGPVEGVPGAQAGGTSTPRDTSSAPSDASLPSSPRRAAPPATAGPAGGRAGEPTDSAPPIGHTRSLSL